MHWFFVQLVSTDGAVGDWAEVDGGARDGTRMWWCSVVPLHGKEWFECALPTVWVVDWVGGRVKGKDLAGKTGDEGRGRLLIGDREVAEMNYKRRGRQRGLREMATGSVSVGDAVEGSGLDRGELGWPVIRGDGGRGEVRCTVAVRGGRHVSMRYLFRMAVGPIRAWTRAMAVCQYEQYGGGVYVKDEIAPPNGGYKWSTTAAVSEGLR
ncbi:hypothetical protein Tco_1069849 [Tanacetum coccineum]|uniref:Uncharacterized protein n=1 Tax=Tanacetum coccineum TaxID=301880 RepID=A0ABQ5HLK3_9ASTR